MATKLLENPSPTTLAHRLYRWKHRHPCKVCGNPCDNRNELCRVCWSKRRIGENHPNWKGGRYHIAKGYIVVLCPGHPRATTNSKYVLEHILVWEKANKKVLPKGWIIHHLNGIKDDNRIENLVALPNNKHYLVLPAKAKRIQELEALLKQQGQLL